MQKTASGDFSLQNETRGRPIKSVKNDAQEALETNSIVSTRELATRTEVDYTAILVHLSEISKFRKMDKWTQRELGQRNKLEGKLFV